MPPLDLNGTQPGGGGKGTASAAGAAAAAAAAAAVNGQQTEDASNGQANTHAAAGAGADAGETGDGGRTSAATDARNKSKATTSASSGSSIEPLALNSLARCLWRDGSYKDVKIIESRIKYEERLEGKKEYEYYVHFLDFNRRLDTWVTMKELELPEKHSSDEHDTSKNGGEASAKNQGGGRRRDKRRNDAGDANASGEKSARKGGDDKKTGGDGDAGGKCHGHAAGRGGGEHHAEDGHEDLDPARVREHEELTKVKNIGRLELGRYEMETWYFSPFPKEFEGCSKLYACEFCLTFLKRKEQLQRHLRKCQLRHPPGDEIYRNGNVSMFEVDGRKEKVYCQNLCYIAKLFLDHKTLYYDVDLFLFYVLCETDDRGCHMVGYFSKEKNSEEGYNLACILTLPPYQRKGYGKFLISFSYELSKKEKKVGTPERPLSDLGVVSYRGYWTRVLLNILKERQGSISVKELSDMTMFKSEDIISTLQHHNLIQYQKGQHVLCAAPSVISHHMKMAGRPGVEVDPKKLIWTPYDSSRDYMRGG